MKTRLLLTFSLTLIISFGVLAQNYGAWREIDSLNIITAAPSIGELPDGNLIVSGFGQNLSNPICEVYETDKGKWRLTASFNIRRFDHKMILLNNGKIIAVGSYRKKSCEIFDPLTETWTFTDSLIYERWYGKAVLKLSDGNVMIIGGMRYDTTVSPWKLEILDKVEIFDISLQRWIQVGSLNIGRAFHTATLLPDGKVLVTGGKIEMQVSPTNTCEIYDPVNKSWQLVSNMYEERENHSAIILDNNRVLVSGSGGLLQFVKKSSEVYLIKENIWIQTGDMFVYRRAHLMVDRPEINKIMIIGGDVGNSFDCRDSYEFYDKDSLISTLLYPFPTSQTLSFFGDQNMFQSSDGRIYVIGGAEVICYPMPMLFPTKRCWIFDTSTKVENITYTELEYQLYQNFPNPFNPVTTIGYNLKEQSKVELKVFDILGNELTTLVDDNQQAGYHQTEFNTNNLEKSLSSGIYLYQIKARAIEGSRSFWQKTNKMILLK